MSGGSYNYLCYAEANDLFQKLDDLRRMAERLADLGYEDAAGETTDLLLSIRQCERHFNAIAKRMYGVWRAVEWCDSGDSGEDEIKEAITKYRV